MPAVVGQILINQISGGGNAIFGDAPFITPKSTTKSYAGAGGGNFGVFTNTFSVWSITNTLDPDVNDSNIVAPDSGVLTPATPIPLVLPSRRKA
ncbi:MAG: spore germination protein [Bacilli bacterium]|nr:spore germination protein [Bacilli bacterium]